MHQVLCIILAFNLLLTSCGLRNPFAENLDNAIRIEQYTENDYDIFLPDGSTATLKEFSLPLTPEMEKKLKAVSAIYPVKSGHELSRPKVMFDFPRLEIGRWVIVAEGKLPDADEEWWCIGPGPHITFRVIEQATGKEFGQVRVGLWRNALGNGKDSWGMNMAADGEMFPDEPCWESRGPNPTELLREVATVLEEEVIPRLYEISLVMTQVIVAVIIGVGVVVLGLAS